jgi:leader peptidase (prepilin peptidase)/N-methyltransferase
MQFFNDLVSYEVEVTAEGRWALIAALALLGAVFGSFMNVVVYRLPRKMSLSRPGSRCPKCEHPIRWYDNVPVFGWLALGGRCRDCGAGIPPRYPLVEALVATLGGLLAWRAPTLVIGAATGDGGSLFAVDLAWYCFHLLLIGTLICAALIEFDGYVPPKRLILTPLVLGLAMLVPWPHLQPLGDLVAINGLVAGFVGMLTAVILGAAPWLTWVTINGKARFAYATAAVGELVLIGGFLGDHAVISIGLESMVLYLVIQLAARKWPAAGHFGWAGPLTLVTLVWVLTWPGVAILDPQLSGEGGIRLLIACSIMIVLAIVMQFAVPLQRRSV